MKIMSVLASGLIFLTACGHQYQYWDTAKFNMADSALKDGEQIKLLYCTRSPDGNEDKKYYVHLVAVSQKTGDTVNILTTIDNGFDEKDSDKVFNFIDKNNIASKITEGNYENVDANDLKELEKTQPKTIGKVIRDPNFDEIADNNYSTVIGSVGVIISKSE